MLWKPNRRDVLKSGTAALIAGAASRLARAKDIPPKPEPGAIKMGIEPWLGYGQWHIAAKKGFFGQAGLEPVSGVSRQSNLEFDEARPGQFGREAGPFRCAISHDGPGQAFAIASHGT